MEAITGRLISNTSMTGTQFATLRRGILMGILFTTKSNIHVEW